MEMLQNMPNNKTLKELLEFSTVFARMCREQGEQRGAFPFAEDLLPEDFLRVPELSKGGQREVIEYAYNLKSIAQLLTTATPGLLEAAMGFDKLVGFINPLLHKMVRMSSELNYTLAELDEVHSKCERVGVLLTNICREERREWSKILVSDPVLAEETRRNRAAQRPLL
jgi:hypothetical protein